MSMNRIIFFMLVSIFTLSATAMDCPNSGTVKDYFVTLVDQLDIIDDVSGPITTTTELEKNIKSVDVKNGYLELQNESIIPKVSATLFYGKGGTKTVAVTSDGVSVQNYYAFVCKNNKWENNTKSFFPVFSFERLADLYKNKGIKISGHYLSAKEMSVVAHSLARFRLPTKGRAISVLASHPDLTKETKILTFSP